MGGECNGSEGQLSITQRLREQMPITRRWVYFDHAAVAPLPEPTRQEIRKWLNEATEMGGLSWQRWSARLEEVRKAAAELIGAEPAEIALVPNTTSGISLIAEGFPWREGDNVVTLENEFPSNQYPWMNLSSRGVELRRVPVEGGVVDLDRVADACDARTRIVSLSWVGYATGWRIDVREAAQMCHDRGCLLFLDAIQGLGLFPLDVTAAGVDFLAADGHKWLLGPEGAGILYIRRPHLERLRPLMVGWNSVVQRSDYSRIELRLRPEAARYEGGSLNMVGFLGLGASLDLLRGLGVSPRASPLAEHVLAVTDAACQGLQAQGAELHAPRVGPHRSGIVTFRLPGHASAAVRQRLEAAGIVARCRAGGVRISPHGYATFEEVDRMIEVLQSLKGG